jgi:ribonuclease HepT-like protein
LQDIEAFEKNPQVQDAVIRNIEIIGEAVNHINRVAPDFIARHPQLPWAQMRDMRNVGRPDDFQIHGKICVNDAAARPAAGSGTGPLPMKAPVRADGGGDDLAADPRLPDHPSVAEVKNSAQAYRRPRMA